MIYISFGELTALAWGANLTEPFVTQMLPPQYVGTSLIKVVYTISLVCSYPIMIKPTNEILESYIFRRSPPINGQRQEAGKFEYYGSRVSRFLVCLSAGLLGIVLAKDMEKFLGFIGALLGSPLIMTFPALIHYKIVATSRWAKTVDIMIIILSAFTLIFSTALSLQSWIS